MNQPTILINAERCPFCNGDRLWVWDKGVPGKFAICCSNPLCAATGPMASSEAEALTSWNKALRRLARKANQAFEHAADEMHLGGR